MVTAGSGQEVLVAMSGGVDSSVVALLLKEAGYKVTGATMQLWIDEGANQEGTKIPTPNEKPSKAVLEASRIAAIIKIPHLVLNLREPFYEKVVTPFIDDYLQGKTPNPCVICNRQIKFASMLEEASKRGIHHIATGHYVRRVYDSVRKQYQLLKGLDPAKDQSYMLYRLSQKELTAAIFPLGDQNKTRIRELAAAADLQIPEKAESQEVCFIPDNDYRAFLKRNCPQVVTPGEIVSTTGKVLGCHQGIAFYTVGQRKGLGITASNPLYVTAIDPESNRIIVGEANQVYSSAMVVTNLNFISGIEPSEPLAITIKIRYRAPVVEAILYPPLDQQARVVFQEPQKAVTPGQAAVFYQDEEVLGGGTILKGETG